MANTLESSALSAFCESLAMMIGAGIQTDEAVYLLSENMADGPFKRTCDAVYLQLIEGKPLAEAMTTVAAFPDYAVSMVRAGEESGRLENVLYSLATYYSEEDRLFAKVRNAVLYPAVLLAVMTVILAFTVAMILPVFMEVYSNIAGGSLTGSLAYVNLSSAIGVIALIIMAICTACAIACTVMSRGAGRATLIRILERVSFSSDALYHMSLARFTAALATYVSAGIHSDRALAESISMTENKYLRDAAQKTYDDMVNPDLPKNLAQAIYDTQLFDPIYARMLLVGGRSGATEKALQSLSDTFFDDAVVRIDDTIDSVEPALAAFLTVAVGGTLISVMLPLVGIMSSIG